MRKLRLAVDDLAVESFPVQPMAVPTGTVRANDAEAIAITAGCTVYYPTCALYATCPPNCDSINGPGATACDWICCRWSAPTATQPPAEPVPVETDPA